MRIEKDYQGKNSRSKLPPQSQNAEVTGTYGRTVQGRACSGDLFLPNEREETLGCGSEKNEIVSRGGRSNSRKDATKFNSSELENINSRMILLKDIQWALEKDNSQQLFGDHGTGRH